MRGMEVPEHRIRGAAEMGYKEKFICGYYRAQGFGLDYKRSEGYYLNKGVAWQSIMRYHRQLDLIEEGNRIIQNDVWVGNMKGFCWGMAQRTGREVDVVCLEDAGWFPSFGRHRFGEDATNRCNPIWVCTMGTSGLDHGCRDRFHTVWARYGR